MAKYQRGHGNLATWPQAGTMALIGQKDGSDTLRGRLRRDASMPSERLDYMLVATGIALAVLNILYALAVFPGLR